LADLLQSKEQMRRANSRQWQDGYPAIDNITAGIENGYGYVSRQKGMKSFRVDTNFQPNGFILTAKEKRLCNLLLHSR
jgi:hypothetical protein